MEPVEQISVTVPVTTQVATPVPAPVPAPLDVLDEQEIHRLARCIKEYVEAAHNETRENLKFTYFGHAYLIRHETYQLALRVVASDPQGVFGPAMSDGSKWPYLWSKQGAAVTGDMQRFTAAAVALLDSRQPAVPVDPSLLAQLENEL